MPPPQLPQAPLRPRPLTDLTPAVCRQLEGLLTDIDDTLTTNGRLTAAAYRALERAHVAGLLVIPVTGRPAGWADQIARLWPVAGVVAENGALYLRRRSGRMVRRTVRDDQAVERVSVVKGEINQ